MFLYLIGDVDVMLVFTEATDFLTLSYIIVGHGRKIVWWCCIKREIR